MRHIFSFVHRAPHTGKLNLLDLVTHNIESQTTLTGMAILNYLGFGRPAPAHKDNSKSPVRALPASWYTSEEMYQLERRAIFSRRWMLITHKIRLSQTGD